MWAVTFCTMGSTITSQKAAHGVACWRSRFTWWFGKCLCGWGAHSQLFQKDELHLDEDSMLLSASEASPEGVGGGTMTQPLICPAALCLSRGPVLKLQSDPHLTTQKTPLVLSKSQLEPYFHVIAAQWLMLVSACCRDSKRTPEQR